MTTSLADYQLPKEVTLGHVCFWTVTNPWVTHSDFVDLIHNHGLSKGLIPGPPRLIDAFKRACRYSERKGLPVPLTPNTINFLIRPVRMNKHEVERHLVLELVDPEGRKLDYYDVAHFVYKRADAVLNVTKLSLKSADMTDMVDETIQRFAQEFDRAAKTVDPQVIRSTIRSQLEIAFAVPVRRHGSVYFIPIQYQDTVSSLEGFLPALGEGCSFHSIPLVDTAKQRELVRAAFDEEIHNQATQLITTIKNTKANMSQAQWANHKKEYNELKEKYLTLQPIVAGQLDQAQLEIEALEAHLAELIMGGYVK